MKYCVISMTFNNYDSLREPEEIDSEYCDYLFFTDNHNLTSEKWKVIYLPEFDTDQLTGVQKTYKFKYVFYKYIDNLETYDYIVFLDASIQLHKSLLPIVQYLKKYKYDYSIGLHPDRDNVFDEYNAWINGRGLDKKYKKAFLQNNLDYDFNMSGLLATTIKIYRNCKEIYNFIDDINNMMAYSNNYEDQNDQCYTTCILYKYLDKLRVNYHDFNLVINSKYMSWCLHNSPQHAIRNIDYVRTTKFLNRIIKITHNDEYES